MKRRKNKYIPPKTESSAKNDQFSFKKLIAILLVVNLLTTGVSFSKYVTSSGPASDFARVAAFHVNIVPQEDDELSAIKVVPKDKEVEYFVTVENRSEVDVECSVVLTMGAYDTVNASDFTLKCQLNDNTAQTVATLPAEGKTQTFNKLGTIDPLGNGTLKVIFKANNDIPEDFINGFITGIKLSVTLSQVD